MYVCMRVIILAGETGVECSVMTLLGVPLVLLHEEIDDSVKEFTKEHI